LEKPVVVSCRVESSILKLKVVGSSKLSLCVNRGITSERTEL